jgi:hypothetical protein
LTEANVAFDPEELICPGCSPDSAGQNCKIHGRDWIAHKCRFCCNIANWYCWGNTHFCTDCHKTGTWQTLVSYRSGKNKRKLWEYHQCKSLQQIVTQIGHDLTLNDLQKNERISKLLCDPRACPLGVAHPPNGVSFCLGCSMCTEGNNWGKVLQSRAEEEANAKQRMLAVRQELTKAGNKEFKHIADFDVNGIMYYLGKWYIAALRKCTYY